MLIGASMESQELALGKAPRRNYGIHIACITLFLCLSAQGGVITRWIGLGANSLWTNPTNWDALAVPGVNSDVIITNTGANHIVLNVDTTVASVTVGGGVTTAVLDVVGVTLQTSGQSVIGTNGTIEIISNSVFAGSGSFQNFGTLKVPANTGTVSLALNCNFTNCSTIKAETNSTLSLTGSDLVQPAFLNGTIFSGPGLVRFAGDYQSIGCFGLITINGIVQFQRQGGVFGYSVWSGPGLFRWQSGGIAGVTFAPDFHVELSGEESISGSSTNQGSLRLTGTNHLVLYGGTFYNSGLFQIETNCYIEGLGGDFANSGTIKVPAELGAQTLAIDCNFTNSGAFVVETNSLLDLPGFSFFQSAFFDGTTFAGAGTVRLSGQPESIECHGVVMASGTVEFQRQGSMFGGFTWTGPGLLRWTGANMGGVTFAPNFHVEMSGEGWVSGDCTNQGSMRVVGTNEFGINGGIFYNSGLFQIETNCDFLGYFPSGTFNNSGTIRVPADLGTQTVTFNCNFTNSGSIDVETNSTLDLPGISMMQFSLLDGTTFAGPGTVRFSGADEGIGCAGLITVNGTIEFQRQTAPMVGPSTWAGPGLFRWTAGGVGAITFAPDFHVEMSGLQSMFQDCTNLGSVRIVDANYLYFSYGTFHNHGLFQLETNCTFEGYFGSIENSGTIKVPAGLGPQTFMLNKCNLTNYGTLDVETNSTLSLLGTNSPSDNVLMSFFDGSIFGGSGTLRLLPQDGIISCAGTMNVQSTVEFQSQTLMLGPSKWTGAGLLRWLNGGIVGFTFAPDFHAEITGPDWKFLSLSCTNQGVIHWLGGGNLAGGYLAPEVLYNEGLIQVEADGFWWDFPLINQASGTFDQKVGTLTVDSFANHGTARLEAGQLNVQGNFSSDANSTYQVVLSGTAPVANFNQLNATNMALAGSLEVVLTNGFSPVDGNTFTFVNDISQSGSFGSVTVPALQSNLTWHVQYLPNSVVLEIEALSMPVTTNMGFTNGQFQFSFTGHAAAAYDIQASTNLTDWTTIQTNSPFSGSVLFVDTNSANFEHRYYRCRVFE